jgi:lipopolysaccharide/colanic/teichoic acid biosynthesis glycosyltransferase
MMIIAIAIWINMGRPIFFQHQRPGYKGKSFNMFKFRTMRQPKEGEKMYLTDAERVTKLGNLLRNHSLDELPELINVLKGDMSLVGPRPLLMEYLDLYTEEQKRRHDVKPGITGWAQVNGRQNITFSKRFEYDVWYVDNMNFLLDLKILCLTVKKVFIREGVNTGQSISDVDDIGLLMAASRDESERGSGNDLWEKS